MLNLVTLRDSDSDCDSVTRWDKTSERSIGSSTSKVRLGTILGFIEIS